MEWASDNTAHRTVKSKCGRHTWCSEDGAPHLEGSLWVFTVVSNKLIGVCIVSDWRGPQKPAGTVARQGAGWSQLVLCPLARHHCCLSWPQKGRGQSAPGPDLVCSQYSSVWLRARTGGVSPFSCKIWPHFFLAWGRLFPNSALVSFAVP